MRREERRGEGMGEEGSLSVGMLECMTRSHKDGNRPLADVQTA